MNPKRLSPPLILRLLLFIAYVVTPVTNREPFTLPFEQEAALGALGLGVKGSGKLPEFLPAYPYDETRIREIQKTLSSAVRNTKQPSLNMG